MAEAAPNAFLKRVDDGETRGEADHRDGCFARLRNVEEIVQQRLAGMSSEEVEFGEEEDDGLRCSFLLRRDRWIRGGGWGEGEGEGELGWVREEGEERGECVGVVGCLSVTRSGKLHLSFRSTNNSRKDNKPCQNSPRQSPSPSPTVSISRAAPIYHQSG